MNFLSKMRKFMFVILCLCVFGFLVWYDFYMFIIIFSPEELFSCDKVVSILLVDDSIVLQKTVKRVLESERYQVSVCPNGAEALEILKENGHTFDVVIMGLEMPRMDGFEASKRYRAYEKETFKTRLPIIGMSANNFSNLRQLCIDTGMDDFITKPFKIKELNTIIKAINIPNIL